MDPIQESHPITTPNIAMQYVHVSRSFILGASNMGPVVEPLIASASKIGPMPFREDTLPLVVGSFNIH